VTIEPATAHRHHLNLKSLFGSLYITSTPEKSIVFLDGDEVGTTPVTLEKIAKGTHRLSARKACYAEATQPVTVDSGEATHVSLVLNRICGSARIASEPPGASVYLNEKRIGQTPFESDNLPEGEHRLRIIKAGYPPHETTIGIAVGKATQSTVRLSREWTEPYTQMPFAWVPEGCFEMGCGTWSPKCSRDEQPVHEVCLDGFWMAKYEVTQQQWQKVMGANPAFFQKGDNLPVEQVSWNDAKRFVDMLNARSDGPLTVNLPTEAQWEFAARDGGGNHVLAGDGDIAQLAWFNANSGGRSHPVGTKAPNRLGLYDMSGNVWEWCADVYHDLAYTRHDRRNPLNTLGESYRVTRGASWFDAPRDVRTTKRSWNDPDYKVSFVGFRLAAQ
jgi:formylglycine-generating enzyme required for sulfatase activity